MMNTDTKLNVIPKVSITKLAKMVIEANVFLQIVRDLCIELYNMPFVREKCRTDYISICSFFEIIEKRYRRGLNNDTDLDEERNILIAAIADEAEPYIKICRNQIKGKLLNHVRYDKIDFATVIGMAAGFIDCIQQINKVVNGKRSTEMTMITGYLKHTENNVKIEGMNNTNPDFADIISSMEDMFRKIGVLIEKHIQYV